MVIMKKVFKVILGLVSIFFLILFVIITPYLWKNWVTYPNLEEERAELWAKYKTPQKFIPLNEYKGVFHMHSYWSHDSRGVSNEILPAAKKAGYNFLFFADHAHGKLDTFPRSYHGVYDGIIFEPGTENSHGFMVIPMKSKIVDWNIGETEVIHELVSDDGLVI